MLIRTPSELGAIIRDRRKQLKLDQAAFARQIGVSRQWVIEIERGHARAELGLVLRAMDILNIRLDAVIDPGTPPSSAVNIDMIVARAKEASDDE